MTQYVVAALYHFTAFDNLEVLKSDLSAVCTQSGVKGTLLIADEGINGTIAGTRSGINRVLGNIRALPGCDSLEHKESFSSEMPFLRMKVRLKKEIVTMGVASVDPNKLVGTYVEPSEWNALISRDDVVVIDTRNDYEVDIGTFESAIDPKTASFGEFPEWWTDNAGKFAGKKVAMFCTGGIRCEKATSFLRAQGHDEVFHLKGGILKYLEEVPKTESLWHGECFVFDQRVSVGHGLQRGDHSLCYACRRPITEAEQASEDYEHGVSCPRCIDEISDAQRDRFRERQKQVELAGARGERHIGS